MLINGTNIQSVDRILSRNRRHNARTAKTGHISTVIAVRAIRARRIVPPDGVILHARPNMFSARGTRFSIFSTAPLDTIRYRWSIRARIRTAAAFMFRDYIICMNFFMRGALGLDIGWTENFNYSKYERCATVESSVVGMPCVLGRDVGCEWIEEDE